jgi:uncharacterized membrane protein YgcG
MENAIRRFFAGALPDMPLGSFLLINILLLFFSSAVFAQDFTIKRFHADIAVIEDSTFTVKETIEVEFHRPRHGIYREIPFSYTDELGRRLVTPVEVLSVTDASGNDWKTRIENQGRTVYVRIGDAEKYVSGHQTYVIFYRVRNAILFFDDHDELYWNVTGNYWEAPIGEASARVMLATKNTSDTLRVSCYTGRYGSREKECRYEMHDNSAEFFTKRNLDIGEGFTVAFGWDKGLVSPPSGLTTTFRKAKENWSFILPVLSLLVMLRLWHLHGRDPRVRDAVTVMYTPPGYDGRPLAPAEVGALVDENLDPRDITSTIVGMAVKGYLKIEETKKEGLIFDTTDYYLEKIKGPDADLGSFEFELMENIFSGTASGIMVSDLKNKFYTNLPPLRKTLYGSLVEKKYFARSPEKVRTFYMVGAVVVAAAAVLSAVFLTRVWVGPASFAPFIMIKSVLAGLLTGLPVFAFSKIMPAKTKAGASVYMDILGFREFMNRTEKDRLERMGDKDLFSRYLPYAIALDVADNWAKAFEGIYQNPPEWYVSQRGFGTFSPGSFSRSVNSMTSTLGTAIFSAPRGSGGGSGGGGSSGGGFGGGGGGSW